MTCSVRKTILFDRFDGASFAAVASVVGESGVSAALERDDSVRDNIGLGDMANSEERPDEADVTGKSAAADRSSAGPRHSMSHLHLN